MTRETELPKSDIRSHNQTTTKRTAFDSNNLILQTLTVSSFLIIVYCLLSFNQNFQYFIYYNHLLLLTASITFIICGTLCNIIIKIEDMPTYYPHPLFWRFFHVVSLWYILFLIILTIQPNINDIRNLFKIFDSSLNTPIETRSYAEDCWNFSYEVIVDKCDRFILGHIVTWFFAGIVCRNRGILWFSQILWEVLEIITCYFIPNFAECWWDQIILDILLCNGIGLELGIYVADKLKLDPREYELSYLFSWTNIKYKTLRFLGCNVNDDKRCLFGKSKYVKAKKKKYFEDFRWIIEYVWALFTVPFQWDIAITMNCFLLKLWLWVPTDHILNAFRWVILGVLAVGCLDELYYGSILRARGIKTKTWSGKVYKFGTVCWTWLFMIFLEFVVVYRAIPSENFPDMPSYNRYWLIATISIIGIYSFILCRTYE